ncbi:MAG: ROK family transcriptional regulator [Actinomycetaceae bacterium]|nr:ROK family transcriptional regulator [Actinomycetaceae bacterium]
MSKQNHKNHDEFAAPAPIFGTKVTGKPEDARHTNLQLVLQQIVQSTQLLSRAKIATQTGITRATVSRLIDEFIEHGFLLENQPTTSTTPGRPATPLELNAYRYIGLGIEINVSSAHITGLDLHGNQLFSYAERLEDAHSREPEYILPHLGQKIDELCAEHDITSTSLAGAVLSVPGLVDHTRETILHLPNLEWSNVQPIPILQSSILDEVRKRRHDDSSNRLVNPPAITVLNEANAAAMATAYQRPGVPGSIGDFLYISGEIGVGGALIRNHQPISGSHGWAGEVGHVCVDPAGPPCQCGSRGCLEQYLGRKAISTNCGFDTLATNQQIIQRIKEGDAATTTGIEIAANALGNALAGIINVIDINTVVLGGALAELTQLLETCAQETLRTHLLSYRWAPVVFQADACGETASSRGGAIMTLNHVLHYPSSYL